MERTDETKRFRIPHTPESLAQRYKVGFITKLEFVGALFGSLTDENVASLPNCCPPEVMSNLREHAADLPADDDDVSWGELIWIHGGIPLASVTQEEIDERCRHESRRFREGVRLFRKWLLATE